ncbi:hypothetical protein JN00_0581 [Metamycoplasma subdolum]|uniref:Lipoprotein-associated protein n=1 Tax=Metamycoplasma subdolum TaxID=92407 RepID=A0A3L9ZY94_9BACT|nr:hypothetical protein [Metamycoplasma subdolum]RMA77416.1 hypothetical protein JN00_0581 [Metamycoplasma subdolum]WPB50407.1 hypothetical protein R9C05_02270 [Metamycoplasma subdolum]
MKKFKCLYIVPTLALIPTVALSAACENNKPKPNPDKDQKEDNQYGLKKPENVSEKSFNELIQEIDNNLGIMFLAKLKSKAGEITAEEVAEKLKNTTSNEEIEKILEPYVHFKVFKKENYEVKFDKESIKAVAGGELVFKIKITSTKDKNFNQSKEFSINGFKFDATSGNVEFEGAGLKIHGSVTPKASKVKSSDFWKLAKAEMEKAEYKNDVKKQIEFLKEWIYITGNLDENYDFKIDWKWLHDHGDTNVHLKVSHKLKTESTWIDTMFFVYGFNMVSNFAGIEIPTKIPSIAREMSSQQIFEKLSSAKDFIELRVALTKYLNAKFDDNIVKSFDIKLNKEESGPLDTIKMIEGEEISPGVVEQIPVNLGVSEYKLQLVFDVTDILTGETISNKPSTNPLDPKPIELHNFNTVFKIGAATLTTQTFLDFHTAAYSIKPDKFISELKKKILDNIVDEASKLLPLLSKFEEVETKMNELEKTLTGFENVEDSKAKFDAFKTDGLFKEKVEEFVNELKTKCEELKKDNAKKDKAEEILTALKDFDETYKTNSLYKEKVYKQYPTFLPKLKEIKTLLDAAIKNYPTSKDLTKFKSAKDKIKVLNDEFDGSFYVSFYGLENAIENQTLDEIHKFADLFNKYAKNAIVFNEEETKNFEIKINVDELKSERKKAHFSTYVHISFTIKNKKDGKVETLKLKLPGFSY